MQKPLYVKLHVISPVHIGCDDVYEPTGFAVDTAKRKLVVFDPFEFIKNLSSKDRGVLSSICMEGTVSSIIKLYKFIASRSVQGREVPVAEDLLSHYGTVKALPTHNERKLKQELNRFQISRTAYNPYDEGAYIPGSSLKGALKTAYLSRLAGEEGITNWPKKKAGMLEEKLLKGNFATDPFRMVKVSDLVPADNVKTKIVYAVNKKKKLSKFDAQGPYQVLETIQPGSVFSGCINIEIPDKKADITNPVTDKLLIDTANDFYRNVVNSESSMLKAIQVDASIPARINEQFKGCFKKRTAVLVRIGRHSGAESVTIEGNRKIQVKTGKNIYIDSDHATTVWLASENRKPKTNIGLEPFGWAVLEITDTPAVSKRWEDDREQKVESVSVTDREDLQAEQKKVDSDFEDPAQVLKQRIDALSFDKIAGMAASLVADIETMEPVEKRPEIARHFMEKIGKDKKKFKKKEWFAKLTYMQE